MGVVILIIIIVAALVIRYKFKSWLAQGSAEMTEIHRRIDAANNGDVDSMHWLGTYYMMERSHMKNLSSNKANDFKNRSIQWYTKAINCGDTRSMMDLSRQYSDILNTNQSGVDIITDNSGFGYDPDKQLALMRMAAESGDAYAQYRLSLEIADFRNKIYWLEKSANQGYSKAYQELGDLYSNRGQVGLNNVNIDVNLGKAEHYYYLAMQSNDEDICPNVALNLGLIFGFSYVYGNKPNSYENVERALYWFYQSVLWKNEQAQKYINDIAENTGIRINDDKLRQWCSDFQNHNYLTTKRMIPDGTKYQRLK